jgi:hypothetical protein
MSSLLGLWVSLIAAGRPPSREGQRCYRGRGGLPHQRPTADEEEIAMTLAVAQLRALTDDELIRRHDAVAAEEAGNAVHRSTVYLDELRARMVEQQIEKMMRRLVGLLIIVGLLLVATLVVLIVAL